jgi:hypothetical protein
MGEFQLPFGEFGDRYFCHEKGNRTPLADEVARNRISAAQRAEVPHLIDEWHGEFPLICARPQ